MRLNYTLAYTLGRQRRKEIEPVAEVLSRVLPKLKMVERITMKKFTTFYRLLWLITSS
ncbi:MAG: hypothetical protein J7K36_03840 [Archaeoglobaceae archaeon]|nr:hypothetical protein [Archaeoglobaceae archaeon]